MLSQLPRRPTNDAEVWIADSGSTHHTTGSFTHVFDKRAPPSDSNTVVLGDGKVLPVLAVGSLKLRFYQSNHEGQIIDFLQAHRKSAGGVVINPGGLTHYSVALRDAIAGCQIPTVEVHISDIHAREEFRQVSMVKDVCLAQISGQGKHGYVGAIKLLTK